MGKDGRVGFLIVLVVAIAGVVWWMSGENPEPVNFTPDEPVAAGGSTADQPPVYDAFRDAPRSADSSETGMPATLPTTSSSGDIEIGAPDEEAKKPAPVSPTTSSTVAAAPARPTTTSGVGAEPMASSGGSTSKPTTVPVTPSEPADLAHGTDSGSEETTSEPAVPAGPKTHVVQPGEYLSTISQEHYGTIQKWKVIADANKDLLKGDANRLAVGMKLVIPAITEDKTEKAKTIVNTLANQPKQAILKPGEDSYVIQPGDSLYKIATRLYGNGNLYKKLYNANTDVLNSETDLVVGTKIRLPDFSQEPNPSAPAATPAKKPAVNVDDLTDDLPVGLPSSGY